MPPSPDTDPAPSRAPPKPAPTRAWALMVDYTTQEFNINQTNFLKIQCKKCSKLWCPTWAFSSWCLEYWTYTVRSLDIKQNKRMINTQNIIILHSPPFIPLYEGEQERLSGHQGEWMYVEGRCILSARRILNHNFITKHISKHFKIDHDWLILRTILVLHTSQVNRPQGAITWPSVCHLS